MVCIQAARLFEDSLGGFVGTCAFVYKLEIRRAQVGSKSVLQNSVTPSAHAEVVPQPITAQQQRPCFVLNEIASAAARECTGPRCGRARVRRFRTSVRGPFGAGPFASVACRDSARTMAAPAAPEEQAAAACRLGLFRAEQTERKALHPALGFERTQAGG